MSHRWRQWNRQPYRTELSLMLRNEWSVCGDNTLGHCKPPWTLYELWSLCWFYQLLWSTFVFTPTHLWFGSDDNTNYIIINHMCSGAQMIVEGMAYGRMSFYRMFVLIIHSPIPDVRSNWLICVTYNLITLCSVSPLMRSESHTAKLALW